MQERVLNPWRGRGLFSLLTHSSLRSPPPLPGCHTALESAHEAVCGAADGVWATECQHHCPSRRSKPHCREGRWGRWERRCGGRWRGSHLGPCMRNKRRGTILIKDIYQDIKVKIFFRTVCFLSVWLCHSERLTSWPGDSACRSACQWCSWPERDSAPSTPAGRWLLARPAPLDQLCRLCCVCEPVAMTHTHTENALLSS